MIITAINKIHKIHRRVIMKQIKSVAQGIGPNNRGYKQFGACDNNNK